VILSNVSFKRVDFPSFQAVLHKSDAYMHASTGNAYNYIKRVLWRLLSKDLAR
jgi:hypothetical protein